MRNYVMLAAIAVGLLVGFGAARAAQTQTPLTMAGVPDLTITCVAQAVEVLATDPGTSSHKRAQVVQITDVDGREFFLLVRVERAVNGLFLDIVGEATVGELTTRTTGMTITGGIHPTVGEDAIDVAVLAAAAE